MFNIVFNMPLEESYGSTVSDGMCVYVFCVGWKYGVFSVSAWSPAAGVHHTTLPGRPNLERDPAGVHP